MRDSNESRFVTPLMIASITALAACGGQFTGSNPDNVSAGGAGGVTPDPDSGAGTPDGAILIDGNDARCPLEAPAAYSNCASDQFICDYRDADGCPRRFTCITQGSVAAGVGGAFIGGSTMWIAQSPMPGDACPTPGKICSYQYSYPNELVCTDANVWVEASSTTTIGTSSSTTYGSTSFTVGGVGGAAGSAPGESGSGGAAGM